MYAGKTIRDDPVRASVSVRHSLTVMPLLVLGASWLGGCDQPMQPPPPVGDQIEIVDDMWSSHLATLILVDGTRVSVYGVRDSTGVPLGAEDFRVEGPAVAPLGAVRLQLDIENGSGTLFAGDGSSIEYQPTSDGDSLAVRFRDASIHEVEEFIVPWSEGLELADNPGRGEQPQPHILARPGRSFRLFCPGGQPYRGAIAAAGEISSSTGISETVRIRRSQADRSIFTYQLPAAVQSLATPVGCQRLYRALDRILASTPTLVLRELCTLLKSRIPDMRSKVAFRVFCTAAEAILGFAQFGDAAGITPVCRQALAREIPGMDVAILTEDGYVELRLPIDWTDLSQTDALEIGDAPGDRVQWSTGPTLRYGYFDFQADIQSWCVDRGDTEFHLEASPMFPGGGWASEPSQRVTGYASLNGRTRLIVDRLVPCTTYLMEVTRKDPGRSTTLATKVVTPQMEAVQRIRWDPTGAVLGRHRFNPESLCDVWRSDRAGAPNYMTLRACDENGQTDLTQVGWHVIRFLNGILPEITEVEFTCDGGPGFQFTVGGRLYGLGIRNGKETDYAAAGIVTLRVSRTDTYDDLTLSYRCQDAKNCDLATDVNLSLVVPRDQARWFFYER